MFNKALVVSKCNSRINLHKNKTFGDYQNFKANIAKKEFHYRIFPKALVITQHDYFTKSKIDLSTKMRLVSNVY